MRIKYQGRIYDLQRHEVESMMAGVVPDVGRRFFVAINGAEYPIKQVFGRALGLPVAAFPTGYSYSVLARLGFEIIDRGAGDSRE